MGTSLPSSTNKAIDTADASSGKVLPTSISRIVVTSLPSSSANRTIDNRDTLAGKILPTIMETQNDTSTDDFGDGKLDLSQVTFPTNNMEIGHLPQFADVGFANSMISCVYDTKKSFEKIVVQMQENDNELMGLSVEDVIWNNRNQKLSMELAKTCWFTYRSQKTNELYQLFGLMQHEQDLTKEETQALKKKLISYFFRVSQHKDIPRGDSFDHSSDTWKCQEDARLLEILLDPNWRNVIQFAVDPYQGFEIDSSATTVWNTVVAVLFNNKSRYSPKTRFPNDLDFWHFVPYSLKYRSGDLLQERLNTLQSHFAQLVKIWKATGSLYSDLPKPAEISFSKKCKGRSQDDVTKLTTMYMFEIWSKKQDDEFINRLFFGTAADKPRLLKTKCASTIPLLMMVGVMLSLFIFFARSTICSPNSPNYELLRFVCRI